MILVLLGRSIDNDLAFALCVFVQIRVLKAWIFAAFRCMIVLMLINPTIFNIYCTHKLLIVRPWILDVVDRLFGDSNDGRYQVLQEVRRTM
jgi:hypothetical protein